MAFSLDELAGQIRRLGDIDEAAKVVFEDMALRSKGTSLEVAAVVGRSKLERWEVVRVFKALEKIGLGEFKLGRKGAESRFEAYHRLTDIAAIARGNAAAIPDRNEDISNQKPGSHDTSAAIQDLVPSHTLVLRANPIVRVEIPFDITVEEADRLAAFVKSLPAKPQV